MHELRLNAFYKVGTKLGCALYTPVSIPAFPNFLFKRVFAL